LQPLTIVLALKGSLSNGNFITPTRPQPTAVPLSLPRISSTDPEYGKDQEILPGRRERVPGPG